MKHRIITIITTLILACFAHAGGGGPISSPIEIVRGELAAARFALNNDIAYYKGYSSQQQVQADGTTTWFNTEFTVQEGVITQMKTYSPKYPKGRNIKIPEGGLPGFPRKDDGETRYLGINFDAYGPDGKFVSYAWFYADLFDANESIVFIMKPAAVLISIPFGVNQIPAGVKPENLVLTYGNNSASYDSYTGGFEIYIDPIAPPQEWVLSDQTTGFVYPFDPTKPAVISKYAGIGIGYAGNVRKIEWAPQGPYSNNPNQQLDGVVDRNGETEPGKTFFTDLKGSGLQISPYGLTGTVEVFRVEPDGTPKLVKTQDVLADDYWTSVLVPSGYGPIFVTFRGDAPNTNGFGVTFYLNGDGPVGFPGG